MLLGFLLRRGSRNRMDCGRNSGRLAESVLNLSGQGLGGWPWEGAPTVPCTETCCNLLRHGGTAQIQGAITDMVARLIRGKSLEAARFRGHVMVAVDGVEQEETRLAGSAPRRERRFQLEARVVAPNGLSLSVMSERVRPHTTESGKRDSEIAAFRRLARRLRKAFPRLPVCIVGDALYACAPVMRICRGYGWHFVLTFKEGRSPEAYREACALMEMSKGRCGALTGRADGQARETGLVAWTDGVLFTTQERGEEFRVVACEETAEGLSYRGMFATDFDVWNAESASDVVEWGRRRWNAESGFNVEKNNGYGLEHVFCNHWRCSRNFYLLMQLAHNLWQMFHLCVLPKVSPGCRKMSQVAWVELLWAEMRRVGMTVPFEKVPRRYVRRMIE